MTPTPPDGSPEVDPETVPEAGDGRGPVDSPTPAPDEGNDWWRPALVVGAVLAFGIVRSLPTVIVILALVIMIFLHELGHYVTAKWSGMKVTEFFLGFGPRLWSFRRGETEYGLKAIPAGAYVRIIGMSNLEEVDPADESRTYRQKSYPRRLSVAVAGSAMHFLMALVLWYVIVVGFGVARADSDQWSVGELSSLSSGASPAEGAGVEVGDRVVAINGQRFASFDDLASYVRARPDEAVAVTVERDGVEQEVEVTLASREVDGETVGYLGIAPEFDTVRAGVFEGAVQSVQQTGETMWLSVEGLGRLFSPSGVTGYIDTLAGDDGESSGSTSGSSGSSDSGETSSEGTRVTSIVGIVQTGNDAVEAGVVQLLGFLFLINVFIGVFNLVPLLPFDGGHVAVATYERLRSRRGHRYMADISKLIPVTYAVVGVLAFLFVTSIYLDITDPAANPFN